MTELVPLSTSAHQYQPQFSTIDERPNQQYHPQNSRYQAWSPENSRVQLEPKPESEETVTKSCKKHLNTKLLTSILVGLVVCGIPLAVMSSLYVQKKNGSTGDTSSSNSDSANLPSQCSNYITNSDPTRLSTFVGCTSCFYDTSPYFSVGWYRFTGGAGTQLANTPPNTGNCGASYPAWFNGSLPTTAGSTISSIVCVHGANILCNPSYPISISITNCNGFYVFYLPSATTTLIRYCTMY